MAAPTGKSILIRGYRSFQPGDLRDEAWFIVKLTADGSTQVNKIFNIKDVPEPGLDFVNSGIALIGASFYALGGHTSKSQSDIISCLDTQDLTLGWLSCAGLPYRCPFPTVGVAGNFICLFSLDPDSRRQILWGCVYDTAKNSCRRIALPPRCSDCKTDPLFSAAFDFDDGAESCGILVSRVDSGHIYLYNPCQDSWKSYCHFKFSNPTPASLHGHAVLNGKLYLSCCNKNCNDPILLYVYEIGTGTGQLTGEFKVPRFQKMNPDTKPFLVAIADYQLCYLWNKVSSDPNQGIFCVANVVLSGADVTVRQRYFNVDALDLVNFIPLAGVNQIKLEDGCEELGDWQIEDKRMGQIEKLEAACLEIMEEEREVEEDAWLEDIRVEVDTGPVELIKVDDKWLEELIKMEEDMGQN